MTLTISILLATVCPIYIIYVVIKRLYLHPLAGVPGPKLGALTKWYETYFEIAHRGLGGQFTFRIMDLHRQYGPIVRISPNEVHIDDPDFFSVVYSHNSGLDKVDYLKWRFGVPSALFSTPGHDLHRLRRSAQEPYFSKAKIMQLAPSIQAVADKMCKRLEQDYVDKNNPVPVDNLVSSYVADVITKYAFNTDFDWLGYDEFESPFVKAVSAFKNIAHPCGQFPWLAKTLTAVPHGILRVIQPSMSAALEFQGTMRNLVKGIKKDIAAYGYDEKERLKMEYKGTILHGIILSNLPQDELDDEILKDHAISLLAAGLASTQWTLNMAIYYILSDSCIYKKLRNELEQAIPDPQVIPPFSQGLERLRYLEACINESLRLACGQMARSPRTTRVPMEYGEYKFPPGIEISLDTWHMHHNESIFPASYSFVPDRWLGDAKAPDPYQGKPLKHYLTAFGKGTRRCIAESLARTEITICLATILRRFHWELFDTTYDRDIKVIRDLIAPDVSTESRGIRAILTRKYVNK